MEMGSINRRFRSEMKKLGIVIDKVRTSSHIAKPSISLSYTLQGHTTEEEMTAVTQKALPLLEQISGKKVIWAWTGLWRAMKDSSEIAVLSMKLSKR